MYNMGKATYSCDFCGFEQGWDEYDDVHGTSWGCEVCGREFCSKCFADKYGWEALFSMVRGELPEPFEDDRLRCPDCYEKVRGPGR